MTSVWNTQKVPFHIHSSHANISRSADLSSLTIPLDPPLTLPSKYKATASMYNVSAVNSISNISSSIGNNVFFITDSSKPIWQVVANQTVDIRWWTGTYAELLDQSGAFFVASVALAKNDTLDVVATKLNFAMAGQCVISLSIDMLEDKHAVFAQVTKGLFSTTAATGLRWITPGFVASNPNGHLGAPLIQHGQVVMDEDSGLLQISSLFNEHTIDPAHNFAWKAGAAPVRCTLPNGVYAAQTKSADGSFTAVASGLKDIGVEMNTLIVGVTGGAAPTDSILVYTDGIDIVIELLLANDSYSLSMPDILEDWFGIGLGNIANGSLYPPYNTSVTVNYTIPTLQDKSPKIDDFGTLQLRTGLVSALSGEGKPAAILAQFSVPHGTAIGGAFEVIPPVPMEVPCQLPNPCNELRFQLTNLRGQAADMGGNHWSASVVLTIYSQ